MQLDELSLNRNLYKTLQDISTQGADQIASNVAPMPSNAVASGNTVVDINTNAQLINGGQLEPGTYPVATLDIANWGWNQTCNFSSTDDNTVSWVSGSFISADGTSYSISTAGDTGNMGAYPAKTYVYLDINVSVTTYQTTTNVNTCTGIGKVLIAVCQSANVVGTLATFNLVQASQITADNILANSINANKIIAGSITTTQLSATAIDAMTITGALIRTKASGARIEMNGSTNSFDAYDTSGIFMSLGTAGGSALQITPTATTQTNGVLVSSSVGGVGFTYINHSDSHGVGFWAEMDSTGVNNDQEAIYVKKYGSGHGIYNLIAGSVRGLGIYNTGSGGSIYMVNDGVGIGIDIFQNGNGSAISISNAGSGAPIKITSHSSSSNPAINVVNSGTQPSLSISNSSTSTNNAAVYITKGGAGSNMELNSNANSANATKGIVFDLNNAGAGLEHAFVFVGSEYVSGGSGAVGGSQNAKIRIMIGATVYYIPCYTA